MALQLKRRRLLGRLQTRVTYTLAGFLFSFFFFLREENCALQFRTVRLSTFSEGFSFPRAGPDFYGSFYYKTFARGTLHNLEKVLQYLGDQLQAPSMINGHV